MRSRKNIVSREGIIYNTQKLKKELHIKITSNLWYVYLPYTPCLTLMISHRVEFN